MLAPRISTAIVTALAAVVTMTALSGCGSKTTPTAAHSPKPSTSSSTVSTTTRAPATQPLVTTSTGPTYNIHLVEYLEDGYFTPSADDIHCTAAGGIPAKYGANVIIDDPYTGHLITRMQLVEGNLSKDGDGIPACEFEDFERVVPITVSRVRVYFAADALQVVTKSRLFDLSQWCNGPECLFGVLWVDEAKEAQRVATNVRQNPFA